MKIENQREAYCVLSPNQNCLSWAVGETAQKAISRCTENLDAPWHDLRRRNYICIKVRLVEIPHGKDGQPVSYNGWAICKKGGEIIPWTTDNTRYKAISAIENGYDRGWGILKKRGYRYATIAIIPMI